MQSFETHKEMGKKKSTVKSRNNESRGNDMSRKYNRIIDDAVTEVSIEKSSFNDKSRYCDGFSADRGLS